MKKQILRAPPITYRGREYSIEQRDGVWTITVDGAAYQIEDADQSPRRFIRERLRNMPTALPAPALVASKRYPLLLSIDDTVVRAWPAFLPRGKGAKTYVNPSTGDRVTAVKEPPAWIFETNQRPASEFSTVTIEQALEDVVDAATLWLQSPGKNGTTKP